MAEKAESYEAVFKKAEKKALHGMKFAKSVTEHARYHSDLITVQALRRKHNLGEFPRRGGEEE